MQAAQAISSGVQLIPAIHERGRKVEHGFHTSRRAQIETGSAYHGIPESHMKSPRARPKWHVRKYLDLPVFNHEEMAKVWLLTVMSEFLRSTQEEKAS